MDRHGAATVSGAQGGKPSCLLLGTCLIAINAVGSQAFNAHETLYSAKEEVPAPTTSNREREAHDLATSCVHMEQSRSKFTSLVGVRSAVR